MEICD